MSDGWRLSFVGNDPDGPCDRWVTFPCCPRIIAVLSRSRSEVVGGVPWSRRWEYALSARRASARP